MSTNVFFFISGSVRAFATQSCSAASFSALVTKHSGFSLSFFFLTSHTVYIKKLLGRVQRGLVRVQRGLVRVQRGLVRVQRGLVQGAAWLSW